MSSEYTGKILISDPFLPDINFNRTVVFILEHNDEGSFGLVMNHKLESFLSDILEDIEPGKEIPLFQGGPVQLDTLHYLHTHSILSESAKEVIPGLYWGGDFDLIRLQLNSGLLLPKHIRFYLGYSGWAKGQLEAEIQEGSWVVSQMMTTTVFQNNPAQLWKQCMLALGGEYALLANAPGDPQWN